MPNANELERIAALVEELDDIQRKRYRMECAYDNLFTNKEYYAEYTELGKAAEEIQKQLKEYENA